MSWQLCIQDPSGEKRVIPLNGSAILGRGGNSTIFLKDPTLPPEAAILDHHQGGSHISPFWIRILDPKYPGILGDLEIRDAHFPSEIPIRLGETTLALEEKGKKTSLPFQPRGVRSWLTCAESGRELLWMAKKASDTPLSVYLAGETGTGKEVLAHLLHVWSPRKSGPFIPLHCGALPLSLAESELFGHTKGAFTGATHQRSGALMQAHGGTLFLDEVAELPLDIQVKLLRFLENGEIRPIGSDATTRADVRLICATHRPLAKLVEEGTFRKDLYYRIASITLTIPTLRSRPEDIALLAKKFAKELNHSLSSKALLRLQAHSWPGNVRELQHAVERASGLAGTFQPILREDAFDFLISSENISKNPNLELGAACLSLKEMERHLLLKALKLSHGNRKQAAKILGVARSTLFAMLKRNRIPNAKEINLPLA